jgi:hypothetical protein
MLDAVPRQRLEADLLDELGQAYQTRTHIRWQRSDFLIDQRVEGLDDPRHGNITIAKKRLCPASDRAPGHDHRVGVAAGGH